MKIVLEEKDLKYIDTINDAIKNGQCLPVFIDNGETFYIQFTVKDVAKANAFVCHIFGPDRKKEIEEDLGLSVNKIGYNEKDTKSIIRNVLDKVSAEFGLRVIEM